jgi:hypothetical protein
MERESKMKKRFVILALLSVFFSSVVVQSVFSQADSSKIEMLEVIDLISQKPFWLQTFDSCPSEVVQDKETKVDYLEDGCEKSPKGCFEKCKNGDGNSCYALALLIQVKTDYRNESANPLFFRACKLGIMSGCTNRAAFDVDLAFTDPKKATCIADTFEKSCRFNDSWGCTMFGFLLMKGVGREKNLEESVKYFDKACVKFGLKHVACVRAMELKKLIQSSKKKSKKNVRNSNKKTRISSNKKPSQTFSR